jgi:hypothetical protein
MTGNFTLAKDLRRISEAERSRQSLKIRHPRAYLLGGKWHCPDCGKVCRTSEALAKKLCTRRNT